MGFYKDQLELSTLQLPACLLPVLPAAAAILHTPLSCWLSYASVSWSFMKMIDRCAEEEEGNDGITHFFSYTFPSFHSRGNFVSTIYKLFNIVSGHGKWTG